VPVSIICVFTDIDAGFFISIKSTAKTGVELQISSWNKLNESPRDGLAAAPFAGFEAMRGFIPPYGMAFMESPYSGGRLRCIQT
jgi:hypothetical protein